MLATTSVKRVPGRSAHTVPARSGAARVAAHKVLVVDVEHAFNRTRSPRSALMCPGRSDPHRPAVHWLGLLDVLEIEQHLVCR
jgi:hypothetical protein